MNLDLDRLITEVLNDASDWGDYLVGALCLLVWAIIMSEWL